jgi:hypothetical protein
MDPSNCGISGNESADKLTKDGAKHIQQEQTITFHEKKIRL